MNPEMMPMPQENPSAPTIKSEEWEKAPDTVKEQTLRDEDKEPKTERDPETALGDTLVSPE